MAKYTSKLNLKKPEANDFYNVEDSNGNFDKIDEFASRTDNPHSVTKAQVGLGNVDNTSDKNKPISDAQATAIAEAKSVGTNAQANINGHINNKSNPHNITAEQLGVLPLNGGTLSGYLGVGGGKGTFSATDIYSAFQAIKDGNNFRYLRLINPLYATYDVKNALQVVETKDGKETIYNLWGEHNLPYPSQIQNGSYDGNGGTGSKNSVILTFNFNPKIVFVMGSSRTMILVSPNTKSVGIAENAATAFSANVSWGEKSVSFYSDSTSAGVMMNASSTTYNWVAIG